MWKKFVPPPTQKEKESGHPHVRSTATSGGSRSISCMRQSVQKLESPDSCHLMKPTPIIISSQHNTTQHNPLVSSLLLTNLIRWGYHLSLPHLQCVQMNACQWCSRLWAIDQTFFALSPGHTLHCTPGEACTPHIISNSYIVGVEQHTLMLWGFMICLLGFCNWRIKMKSWAGRCSKSGPFCVQPNSVKLMYQHRS